MVRKKVVVLSGAGISAESGISTFRDAGGLWQQHDIMEVASIDGWYKNPALVLEFYNARRRQLHEVHPNAAHAALVALESAYEVHVITQNVDDLHERAGSSRVLHLHGELFKARSTKNPELVYDWRTDITLDDRCELGSQLRPHIVWFGEVVPLIEVAATEVLDADIVIVIGTSLQVYPAAGLVSFAPMDAQMYYIDPSADASAAKRAARSLEIIPTKATVGVPALVERLLTSA